VEVHPMTAHCYSVTYDRRLPSLNNHPLNWSRVPDPGCREISIQVVHSATWVECSRTIRGVDGVLVVVSAAGAERAPPNVIKLSRDQTTESRLALAKPHADAPHCRQRVTRKNSVSLATRQKFSEIPHHCVNCRDFGG